MPSPLWERTPIRDLPHALPIPWPRVLTRLTLPLRPRARGEGATVSPTKPAEENLAPPAPAPVPAAMDQVCEGLGEPQDGFVAAAARRTLELSSW